MSLSKTAAAAQKAVERGQQQGKETWTSERTIKNIRQLREAHLAVPIDQIDVLLAEYDKFLGLFSDYEEPCTGFEMAHQIWNSLKQKINDMNDLALESNELD